MKQVIILDNGTRIEIAGNNAKFIGIDGNVLYDSEADSYSQPTITVPHFFFMRESEREKVEEWFNEVNPKIGAEKKRQREFLDRVERALKVINYDYYIATLEPSFDKDEKIFYKEGMTVARGIQLREWEEKAESFYSKDGWHSELALLEEGDLFKAYRIAMGYWPIEYVCDDSSTAGNYWNVSDSAHIFDVSGAREVGGFKDGIGNTIEIYKMRSDFALVGGDYLSYGYDCPVADVFYSNCPDSIDYGGSGVLVLKRSTTL